MKIVFMDIDLKYYGGSSFLCTSLDDYVDVKGKSYVLSKTIFLYQLTKGCGSRIIMLTF